MTSNPLLMATTIDQAPRSFLLACGEIFVIFDERTQDSGNVSYGISVDGSRYFVKTAGHTDGFDAHLNHQQRVALLRNAVQLARTTEHAALARLFNVIESPAGPLLVYEWCSGERIGRSQAIRNLSTSAFQRFRQLPVPQILASLATLYDLHEQLATAGWIAVDFYDGSLLYHFERQSLRVIDLDHYNQGTFINDMGRMFGSSRFMSPEEFEVGAHIDERSNVFTLGRTAAVFLGDGTLKRRTFRGSDALYDVMLRACNSNRAARFASVADFCHHWHSAASGASEVDSTARSPHKKGTK